jgi:hypothetical protein
MKQTIRPGSHDFRPNAFPWPITGDFDLVLKIDFHENCWFPPDSTPCGRSWNKAGGLTQFFSLNNHNSLLLAWRPADEAALLEVCMYVNDAEGGWRASAPLTMRIDETACMIFSRRGKLLNARLEIWKSEKYNWIKAGENAQKVQIGKTNIQIPISGWLRKVGAWFGGKCKAHKYMELWSSWSIIVP